MTTALPRMVMFSAGGERFGVALEDVREVVVPQPPFTRVPRAGPGVRGAMNLRGRVVAVVELSALVGLAPAARGREDEHVLLLDRGQRGLGLLVGGVLGVEPIPPLAPADAGGLARGVADVRGAPVTVLDAEALEARAASLFGIAP